MTGGTTRRSGIKRLGVLGTFVWDEIHGRDPAHAPIEEWGGITYALSALDAALEDDWEIVPIIKVGSDLAPQARQFLNTLHHVARDIAPLEVPYPNNRVTLYYHSTERRSEYLRGGVPGWQWPSLAPLLDEVDALYINLISGVELDLETAQRIRQHFPGVIYCDLHSLLLAIAPDGLRTPRHIPDVTEWMRCFDFLQVNEDEMHLLAHDAMALAATAMAAGVAVVNVTLGARGVVYFWAPEIERLSDVSRAMVPVTDATHGPVRTSLVPAPRPRDPDQIDPTGCGDVWGATFFARLIAGETLGEAMTAAMLAAVKNANFRGASNLAKYLRGEMIVGR